MVQHVNNQRRLNFIWQTVSQSLTFFLASRSKQGNPAAANFSKAKESSLFPLMQPRKCCTISDELIAPGAGVNHWNVTLLRVVANECRPIHSLKFNSLSIHCINCKISNDKEIAYCDFSINSQSDTMQGRKKNWTYQIPKPSYAWKVKINPFSTTGPFLAPKLIISFKKLVNFQNFKVLSELFFM